MPKFTPGPWKVDLDREFIQNGDVVCVEAVSPCGKWVHREVCTLMLDTGENKDGDDWEEDAANARLIAWSPEMYETLKLCEELLKSLPGNVGADALNRIEHIFYGIEGD